MLDSVLFVHKRGKVLLLAGSGGLKGVRGGMSCGEKVNWQRSRWHKEGVGGVVIGIKYKSTR